MTGRRNLPIGIQTFEEIRADNAVYVDKTGFIAELAASPSSFNYASLEDDIEVGRRALENYRLTATDPLPMLYQAGYLTIKAYDRAFRSFTLGLPNDEVKYGLYENLVPLYAGYESSTEKQLTEWLVR